MRLQTMVFLGLVGLGACEYSTSPSPLPSDQFGRVTVIVGGREWVSPIFLDSTVVFFDAATGRLDILAQSEPSTAQRSLRVSLVATPAVGVYPIGGQGGQGYALWFEPKPVVRPRTGVSGLRGFLSIGHASDNLVIEQLDWTAGRIAGSFTFHAQDPNGGAEQVIHGRFFGRARVISGLPKGWSA
ncbi:MAG: hypothetical protein HOP28_09615 [Gemmatimonadales bacterium]|nr:hypothetical protein [Gemmatimonadales bacterium]